MDLIEVLREQREILDDLFGGLLLGLGLEEEIEHREEDRDPGCDIGEDEHHRLDYDGMLQVLRGVDESHPPKQLRRLRVLRVRVPGRGPLLGVAEPPLPVHVLVGVAVPTKNIPIVRPPRLPRFQLVRNQLLIDFGIVLFFERNAAQELTGMADEGPVHALVVLLSGNQVDIHAFVLGPFIDRCVTRAIFII